MERAVALKKLGKILGKNLGYRVDPKAPDHDDREEARAKLPAARELRKTLEEKMAARRNAILQADEEYQLLKMDHEAAKTICEKLFSICNHYRFTVGVSNSLFFTIRAQGDSWEEVIAKLTTEKQAA